MPTTIVCVYCKLEKPRPVKGEHIFLKGLGGQATIPDVCSACNSHLGRTVDEEYLRKSQVALRRLIDPRLTEGEAPAPQFARTPWGAIDIRLFNSGAVKVLPQMLHDGERVRICGFEDDTHRIDRVLEELRSSDSSERLHVLIRDIDEYSPARLVVARPGSKHTLRARSQEAAEDLLNAVRKVTTIGPRQHTEDFAPDVSVVISMDVNTPGRAAAKMAFNAATYVFGAEAMLAETFDPVRAYILGEDVQEGPTVDEDGEEALIVDERFAVEVEPAPPVADPLWHQLYLGEVGGQLVARVNLLGGTSAFYVRLGPAPSIVGRLPIAFDSMTQGEQWILYEPLTQWSHRSPPPWS